MLNGLSPPGAPEYLLVIELIHFRATCFPTSSSLCSSPSLATPHLSPLIVAEGVSSPRQQECGPPARGGPPGPDAGASRQPAGPLGKGRGSPPAQPLAAPPPGPAPTPVQVASSRPPSAPPSPPGHLPSPLSLRTRGPSGPAPGASDTCLTHPRSTLPAGGCHEISLTVKPLSQRDRERPGSRPCAALRLPRGFSRELTATFWSSKLSLSTFRLPRKVHPPTVFHGAFGTCSCPGSFLHRPTDPRFQKTWS